MQRARVLAVVVVLTVSASAAGEPYVYWVPEVVPPAPGAQDAPSIRVRVVGEPAPSPERRLGFELAQVDGALPRPAQPPVSLVPYHQSSDPLALVVLVEGHQAFIGNDTYASTPCAPGAAPGWCT